MEKTSLESRIKENTKIALGKYWKNGFIPGISSEEIQGLVTKLKNQILVRSGRMSEIEREAESYFRKELSKKDPRTYNIYVSLKDREIKGEDASKFWSEISPFLNDGKIKEDYIRQNIEPNQDLDKELFNQAISEIVKRRTETSFKKYEKTIKRRGLSQIQGKRFVDLSELVRSEASDILYEKELHNRFVDAISGERNSQFLYCVCLRLTHDYGKPDITPHLNPFEKVDKDGQKQFHSGEAQRYQLEKIIEMSENINKLSPEIKQTIMIADFDAYKYGKEPAERIVPKTKEYIAAISDFVGELEVTSEIQYMNQIGFNQKLYDRIFTSIISNDGNFFPIRDIERELENCKFHRSRSINNWNEEMNKYYVATSTSRKLAEGVVLSQAKDNYIMIVFNDNAIAGTRFNYLVKRKTPFVSLPKLGRPVDNSIYW
ncbi:MAG: hypothetical protein ACP5D2_01690 [Candidatus Nanoarchaeia archaeon]